VIWVVGLVALSSWIWVRSRRTGLDPKRARDRKRAERDRRRPERSLERTVREATLAGAVVVVARRGSDPTRVTWSDGSVWFYYPDEESLRSARERHVVPPGPAHVGEPPALGSPRPAR